MYLELAESEALDPGIGQEAPAPAARHDRRRVHTLSAGRHLFMEGDEAHSLYEVRRGMLRLARVMENGRRQIISFALPGDVVGFPQGDHHHTDCDAIVDTVVVAYGRGSLDECRSNPALHRHLTRAALREITAMQDHFMMLSSKSACEKVASFLLTLAQRTGTPTEGGLAVDIAMRRVDIADFLGLTNETVCRSITQLRKDGLIRLQTAQRIVVCDPEGLRARAEPE